MEFLTAMVVAKNHGIITSAESRWDEGITKGEAITFLVNIFNNMDALTNADRGVANGDMVISIDWDSINPATHSTYDSETNTVTIDDTMWNYMYENCPAFDLKPRDMTEVLLSLYLVDYYNDRFGDNEWLQFAITGDTTVLNLSVTDAELLIQSQQMIDNWLKTEEGQQAQQEFEENVGNPQDIAYKTIADALGMTVDEYKAKFGITDTDPTGANSGNCGGGSTPVANPSTQQPNADENNFVTPENPTGGNGSGNSDPWQGDGSFEFDEDPGDGGDIVGPDIIWNY